MQAPAWLDGRLDVLREAFPAANSVRLIRVNDGTVITNPAALNGNGLLAIHDSIEYDRKVDNIINDFRLNWENDRVLFTVGLQSWDVRSNSFNIQDQFLIDVRPNAMRYNVEALDDEGEVVGRLTDEGIITHGSLDNYGGLDIVSNNLYANIEFSLTERVRIDAGVRSERGEMSGWGEDVSFGVPISDSLNDPMVLADDSRSITRNGSLLTGATDYDSRSFTIGGNWAATDQLAVYARLARAEDMASLN